MNNSEARRVLCYLESDDGSNESEDVDDDIDDPDFHLSGNNDLFGINHLSDSDNKVQNNILAPDSDADEQSSILTLNSNIDVQDEVLVIPDSDPEGQDLAIVTKVRKRVRKPETWKRNVSKNNRLSGVEHVSLRNKLISKRVRDPDCLCKNKCFSLFSDEDKETILSLFNAIGGKNTQDTYLVGLLDVKKVFRHRSRQGNGPKKTCSVKYKVKINNSTDNEPFYYVCKKAFASLHGIGISTVERLVKESKNKVASPVDKRLIHYNRVNKMPLSINFQIDTHIKSFPARESYYSRKVNNGVIYLSPDLNISKMYSMYLEKHEPGYLVANRQDQTVQPIVKYAYFANRFSTNFNIHFSNPRSDTCQKCDQLQNMIKSETNEDAINELKLEKEIHIRKEEVFYTDMKRFSTDAKLKDSAELLSFDYQQNMALPYVPAGDVFYKRQLWSYNFCIHSAKTKKSYFFMYDESTAKKGQNEVISFLNYYLLNILSPDVNMVYLFSDNCSAQKQNKLLFAYLSLLRK